MFSLMVQQSFKQLIITGKCFGMGIQVDNLLWAVFSNWK